MDIPRIFTISESEHRIHNPFTEEKYATLGRVLCMKPGTKILDLGSGSGEMLCSRARDHGITGTGIDMTSSPRRQSDARKKSASANAYILFIMMRRVTSPMKNVTWQPAPARPGLPVALPGWSNCWRRVLNRSGPCSSMSPTGVSFRQRTR